MKKVWFDTEFTGLHINTTLISIGLVCEDGATFYAELTDYDGDQVDHWLEENVINNLILTFHDHNIPKEEKNNTTFKGTMESLKPALWKWIDKRGPIELWSDCSHYDMVLFISIFGNAFSLPDNVYYISFDICTLFKVFGYDPDIDRDSFAGILQDNKKHNALYDAHVIKACYHRIMREEKR